MSKAAKIAITSAAFRPRIHPTFMETLKRELGRRDWVKGERAQIHEILVHMRSQAAANGFPSMPPEPNDSKAVRALKSARLDGVLAMVDQKPELLQPREDEIVEQLLFEAAVHGLRPHAGHERATPSHVAKIQRERAAANSAAPAVEVAAMPASSLDAHKRIDELETKIDSLAELMGKIHAAVTAAPPAELAPAAPPAAPAPAPAAPAAPASNPAPST